jgi:hypothetical protein
MERRATQRQLHRVKGITTETGMDGLQQNEKVAELTANARHLQQKVCDFVPVQPVATFAALLCPSAAGLYRPVPPGLHGHHLSIRAQRNMDAVATPRCGFMSSCPEYAMTVLSVRAAETGSKLVCTNSGQKLDGKGGSASPRETGRRDACCQCSCNSPAAPKYGSEA